MRWNSAPCGNPGCDWPCFYNLPSEDREYPLYCSSECAHAVHGKMIMESQGGGGEFVPFCTPRGYSLPQRCIEFGCSAVRAEWSDGYSLESVEHCLNHTYAGLQRVKCGSSIPRKWYQAFAFTMNALAEDQVCVAEPWYALPSRFYGCRQDISSFHEATGCVQCIAELVRAIDVSGLGCVPVEDAELLSGADPRNSDDHGYLVRPKHLGFVLAFEVGASMAIHSPSYSPQQGEDTEMHPLPRDSGCSPPPLEGPGSRE